MSQTAVTASKSVGWEPREVRQPFSDEVRAAIERKDAAQLLTWIRFLPSPETPTTRRIMGTILDGYREVTGL